MTTSATATRGATAKPAAVPFRFFDARVVRTERLGPSMTRITFGGDRLAGFAGGGRDQRFKLFLPQPHQEVPVLPVRSVDTWFGHWRSMDPAIRPVMRSYTVREQRRDAGEFDVDFALHGDGGPASRWAAAARTGDRVLALGPTAEDNAGIDFRPPPGTGWVLLTADLTALPAVAGILSWLPAGTRATVWIEVPDAADIRRLPTDADAEITWLVGRPDHSLLDAVRTAGLPGRPGGAPYAWIAGEAGGVRELRRHLIGERGFDRRAVKSTGYWRRGATEEDLLAEAVSG